MLVPLTSILIIPRDFSTMSEPSIAWNTGDRAIRINLCTLNKNNTFTFYLSGLLFKNALSGSTCAIWTWKNTFTFLLVSYMSYQECTQHSKTPILGGLFIKDTHSHPLTWSPCPCSRWWGRCWPRPPWPWSVWSVWSGWSMWSGQQWLL